MAVILKIVIGIFLLMVVLAIFRSIRGNAVGRSTAVREVKKINSYDNKIKAYEENPEGSGITEDDYLYYCYMSDRPVDGIDLRKAVTFQTTCEVRGIKTVSGMQGILNVDEIYGNMKGTDCAKLYEIGERVSRICQDRRRIDKAE